MQLDIIQKSILGVLGLSALLTAIVPSDLAPKPAEEIPAVAVVAAPPPAPEIVQPPTQYVIDGEGQDESIFVDPDAPIGGKKDTNSEENNNPNSSNAAQSQTVQQSLGADAAPAL